MSKIILFLSTHFTKDMVVEEYRDILPAYTNYVSVKRNYQMGNASYNALIESMRSVCKELHEFIQTLYSGTSTDMERQEITAFIENLNFIQKSS